MVIRVDQVIDGMGKVGSGQATATVGAGGLGA